MSAPKQDRPTDRPEGAVDWAARLKASMDTPNTTDEPEVEIPDEEDDLKALLLAQLNRPKNESFTDSMDTSEFEEEFADEEDLDDEELLDDEEDFDDKELLADEEDFDDEELPADEEDFDDEELPADEEDFDDEELLDDEEDFDGNTITEEYLAEMPVPAVDEEAPGVSREPYQPADGREDTDVRAMPMRKITDEHLNGRSDPAPVEKLADPLPIGGSEARPDRRRQLSEENARLLAEIERRRNAADGGDTAREDVLAHMPDDAEPLTEEDGDIHHVIHTSGSATVYDPLQVGYDGGSEYRSRSAQIRTVSDILDSELPMEGNEPVRRQKPLYTEEMPSDAPVDVHRRDTHLRSELGYTEDLPHAEDRRAIESARSEDARAAMDPHEHDRHVTPTADGREYIGPHTDEEDRIRFRRVRRGRLARSIVAVIGAVLLLVFDFLPHLHEVMPGQTTQPHLFSTAIYPLLCVALTLIVALPFATRLGKGLAGLARFAPSRYSPPVLALAAGLVYCVIAAVLIDQGRSLPLFGGLPICTLAIAALSELMDARGESDAFDIVSAGRPLYVLTDETTPAVAAMDAAYLRTHAPLSAVHTARVDHVFARMGQYNSHMSRLNFLLPAAFCLAVLSAGACLFFSEPHSLVRALRVFTAVYLTALPASYLVSMSLPLRRANRRLADSGSAVIGSAAPDRYAEDPRGEYDEREVCFFDEDILYATRIREIALRNAGDDPNAPSTEHWRRLANRLFRLLHSPLAMEIPFEEEGTPEALTYLHVEIMERTDNFMKVYLIDETPGREETHEVMLGSHEALTARGIHLPRQSKEQDYRRSENSHVIYLVFDGLFRIGYAAEYRVRTDLERLTSALKLSYARPVLISYDPMLTPYMLSKSRFDPLRRAQMEIIRPDAVEVPRRRCSAGVVALGSGGDLVHPLVACRLMKTCYRRAYLFSWIGMGVTVALIVAAMLAGFDVWVNTATLVGLQVLLALLATLIPARIIRRQTLLLPPRSRQKMDRSLKKKPTPDAQD